MLTVLCAELNAVRARASGLAACFPTGAHRSGHFAGLGVYCVFGRDEEEGEIVGGRWDRRDDRGGRRLAALRSDALGITDSPRAQGSARFRILGEMATVSDAGGSLEETFDAICAILVPALADFCMIDLFDEDGSQSGRLRVWPGGASRSSSRGLPSGALDSRPMIEGDRAAPRWSPVSTSGIRPDLRRLADDDPRTSSS